MRRAREDQRKEGRGEKSFFSLPAPTQLDLLTARRLVIRKERGTDQSRVLFSVHFPSLLSSSCVATTALILASRCQPFCCHPTFTVQHKLSLPRLTSPRLCQLEFFLYTAQHLVPPPFLHLDNDDEREEEERERFNLGPGLRWKEENNTHNEDEKKRNPFPASFSYSSFALVSSLLIFIFLRDTVFRSRVLCLSKKCAPIAVVSRLKYSSRSSLRVVLII